MDKRRSCNWCSTDISHLRADAIYCSSKCKTQAHRAAPCFYCGMPAAEREHIIPRSVKRLNNNHTVPTCYECNRIVSNNVFESIEDKQKFIHQKLILKYKKILMMPDWSDEEIEELGPGLKSHVMATIDLKRITLQRVGYLEGKQGKLHKIVNG